VGSPDAAALTFSSMQGQLRELNALTESAGVGFRMHATRTPDARFRFRSMSNDHIRFESWSQQGAATFREPPRENFYHLVMPRTAAGEARSGTQRTSVEAGRSAFILPPWTDHATHHGVGWSDISVAFRRDELERQWESLSGRTLTGRIEFPLRVDLRSTAGARLERMVGLAMRECSRSGGAMHAPATRSTIIDAIYANFLTLPYCHVSPSAPIDAGLRVVRSAEEFMASRLCDAVRMGAVAAHAGVSVRTLQESFRRRRGYGPQEFLTQRRLETAHTMLRTAEGMSVASIALHCGFAHSSHFGAAYRRRFGRTPSATRDAARARNTAQFR